MNGLKAALNEIDAVASGLKTAHNNATALLCVPATLVALASERAGDSGLKIGGETCHAAESGAHTGDISAEMLVDAGASHIIVGHSERRADHAESDAVVASQASAVHRAGAVPIICVGESLEQREANQTLEVIDAQLKGSIPESSASNTIVVAYEPIWAIGTGKVATVEQINAVHNAVRDSLVERFGPSGQNISILYGGSMKPGNAAEILAVEHVNGGLIGGASLKASDFLAIYESAN
ncbi:UNVERIFIED_CONTAM: hypothetical protein GTU68_049222 [Idotea baltica]|nr:hypothetical protein [Idotea baltica]